MISLAFALVLSVAVVARVTDEGMSGPLDGKTFDITFVDQGTGEGTADTLIFVNGTFDSVEFRKYGFGKTPYEATREPEAEDWTFTAEAVSPEEGMTTWVGTVRGVTIEGTMEWAKTAQDPVHYEFQSVLKR